MSTLKIKQGEAKPVTLTITDENGAVVDLSGATLFLGVKKDKGDSAYAFSKEDADFDKTQAASGILVVDLSAEDTDQPESTYIGELKCTWDGPVIIKSEDFFLQIKRTATA